MTTTERDSGSEKNTLAKKSGWFEPNPVRASWPGLLLKPSCRGLSRTECAAPTLPSAQSTHSADLAPLHRDI
jgi:hypothetical protein